MNIRSTAGSFVVIGLVVGGLAAAFAYAAGWLSPGRLSSAAIADAFGPAVVSGHRLNHAKGTCFLGTFHSNGAGAALSSAPMLAKGDFPVVGRFNLGTPDPFAKDSSVRVRGIGLKITAPGGAEWRTAMINPPIFAVSTPQGFYDMQRAGGSKDPDAMKRFVEAHPEFQPFLAWVKQDNRTGSYAEERFNSLNAFVFTDAAGAARTVRWSLLPLQAVRDIPAAQFDQTGPDVLEREIGQRVQAGPVAWTLSVQVAGAGDPTDDPTRAWPADRPTIAVGEVTAERVIPEPDGPCRDVNFDPTVLPTGMATSNDPFPAARSAVYARSFDRRTANAGNYPRDSNPFPPANNGGKGGGS